MTKRRRYVLTSGVGAKVKLKVGHLMIIKPKVRGFICINAHPQGCAANVKEQIDYVKSKGVIPGGPKNVLVIGASTGYGLASRITAAFGSGANTVGLFFEKPASERKTGSAGFYNSIAFENSAKAEGLYAKSLNMDAFSHEAKQKSIDIIQKDMIDTGLGKIDLIVYSLASPRRTDPTSGETFSSVLKPIGQGYTVKNLNTDTLKLNEVTVDPASKEEISNTVKVMGGEDWELWVDALSQAGVLAENCQTSAYTYLGEKLTWPIYGHATIGKAKEDLDRAAIAISQRLSPLKGHAKVSVLKALVTQASSAIPIMPLYISAMFKVMKADGTYEGVIEQIQNLFIENLYSKTPRLDEAGRLSQNYKELEDSVQERVTDIWNKVDTDTIDELTDYVSYHQEFLKLFGFGIDGVDYEADLSPLVAIPNLI